MSCTNDVIDAITLADFKSHFSRDFAYSTDPATGVTDDDLNKAFLEAKAVINPTIYPCDELLQQAFYYAVAHYLVLDIRASGGIGGTPGGLDAQNNLTETSKSVGNVSVSYSENTNIKDDKYLSYFNLTPYGQKFLSLTTPYLIGNVRVVKGCTLP